MSDRFGRAVDPHYRRKQCPWLGFRKADVKNISCLKVLVKRCIQLSTDSIPGL